MKVVIETLGNEIIGDWAFKGHIGAKNAGHDVRKLSLPAASMQQQRLREERPMPIGSHGYMEWFFNLYGVETPKPLNIPKGVWTGRACWEIQSRSELKYPVFVKPLNEHKKFTGFVAKSEKDFDLYPELGDWDGPYFCSDPFPFPIKSEWRIFVLNGKILNVSNYTGDPTTFPDLNEDILEDIWMTELSAFTVDVAVLEGSHCKTEIVEFNRAYSTAPYGIKEDDYFKFLKADWIELVHKSKKEEK